MFINQLCAKRCNMPAESEIGCKLCHSDNRSAFSSEIAIHFPGLDGLNKPIVWVFPKISICLDCGFAEFMAPEEQLRMLLAAAAVERDFASLPITPAILGR